MKKAFIKRISFLTLGFIMIFTLIACDPSEDPVDPVDPVDPTTYLVEFNTNEGSAISSITVEENDLATEPTDPTKEGYVFVYWYLDDENTEFSFSTQITENITLNALWEEEEPAGPTEEDLILLDVEAFSQFEDGPIAVNDLALPSRGENGTTFTWTTSDSTAVTTKGVIIPNPIGGQDKTATLNLVAKNGDTRLTYSYNILIPAKSESVITSTILLPFESLTEEYVVQAGDLLTYFVDNGNVPYVNLQDYMNLLDGFVYADEIEYLYDDLTSVLTMTYEVTYDNDTEDLSDDETYIYTALLNFTDNTITIEDMDFFSGYVQSTGTDYSAGLTYLDDMYIEEGETVVFDLGAYRFDMIHDDGAYVMPLHIINLLFATSSYYNVYYNGDGYKGIYAFGEEAETFRTSSLNSTTASADMKLAAFDTFAFTLDHIYGIREANGIETYYDQLYVDVEDFLSTIKVYVNRAYSDFVLDNLDELHSSMIYTSVFNGADGETPGISLLDLGPRVKSWYDVLFDVQDGIDARWGSDANIPPYRIIEGTNTAVIYLDGFVTKSVDDDDTVVDSDDYMRDAINAMFLDNPNIENIVVDLSYNTGGNVGALYRVLGYVTENPIAVSYQNPLSNEKYTYWVEVETTAITDVNWYFLTSKVTFSAGNLMAAIGQYQDVATIIGSTSGGGASSIIPVILPDGSVYQVSSVNILSNRTGSDEDGWVYEDIEYGVEPDYYLDVADLFNDAAIQALIESILDGTATPYEDTVQ